MSENTKTAPMETTTTPTSNIEENEISKNAEESTAVAEAATPQKPVEEVSPKSQGRARRTPKRMSFTERAQKESEELVKNMGGTLEMEGGRRTRSSARGATPVVVTPPPTKRARASPASASKQTTPRARGRGRKLEAETPPEVENAEEEAKEEDKEAAKEITSKTNGPEKEEEEAKESAKPELKSKTPKNDDECKANDDAEKIKDDHKNSSDDKEETNNDAEKTSEDQPDAVVLPKETVKPELPSNTESEKAKDEIISSTPKEDSPMEVDEPEPVKPVDDKEEHVDEPSPQSQPTAALDKEELSKAQPAEAEKPAEKQPTPEPMEVDSNSKSNDAIGQDTTDSSPTANTATKPEDAAKSSPQEPVANSTSAPSPQKVPETVSTPLALKTVPDVVPVKPEQQPNSNNISNSLNSETHLAKKTEDHENNIANDSASKIDGLPCDVASQGHQAQAIDLKSVGNNIHEENRNNSQTGEKSSQESCEPQIVSPTQMTPVAATADGNNTTVQ